MPGLARWRNPLAHGCAAQRALKSFLLGTMGTLGTAIESFFCKSA